MLDYIVNDFKNARIAINDPSIGAMVICDSAPQAKKMYEIFEAKYAKHTDDDVMMAAETASYGDSQREKCKVKKAALILHDIGSKSERKQYVEDFKEGKIDILFCFQYATDRF